MASITAGTIWRIRPSGSTSNGGGFDPTVVSPGTDYSQQNSAQITYTDLVIGATNTTCTSIANPFTSAHVGNVLNVTGGSGFTVQHVVILSVAATVATCQAALGTASSTGGTATLGGAKALLSNIGASIVQPGNIIYILGVLGNATSYPTTVDYTESSFITVASGNTTAGSIKWIADPNGPMPTLQSNGLLFNTPTYNWFEGLYFTCTSNSNGTLGIIGGGASNVVKNCIFNCQDRATMCAIGSMSGSEITGNDIYGGSTTPSAQSSGSIGINPNTWANLISGNTIRYMRDVGILDGGCSTITNNTVYKCQSDSIKLATAFVASIRGFVAFNTLDSSAGHGINVTSSGEITTYSIHDNVITNHTGSGKYAITVSDGTTALNDLRKRICDYNVLYNNTGTYQNISAGPNDLAVNPGYNNPSAKDWTPANTALKSAFPASFPNGGSASYGWRGAVTPNATGSTVVVNKITNIYMNSEGDS